MIIKKIELTQGQYALVDDADYPELSKYNWYADYCKSTNSFYALRNSSRKIGRRYSIRMSRQILGLERGDKRESDHQNHNTLDNRQKNLRICTHQQNQMNRKSELNKTSIFKGVCWDRQSGKWYASIRINGKQKNLGRFRKEKDAAIVHDKAAKKYHGEFAFSNF